MDEHRDGEVTLRKHFRSHANVVSTGVVLWVVYADLDRTPVFQQNEMVRRLLV